MALLGVMIALKVQGRDNEFRWQKDQLLAESRVGAQAPIHHIFLNNVTC